MAKSQRHGPNEIHQTLDTGEIEAIHDRLRPAAIAIFRRNPGAARAALEHVLAEIERPNLTLAELAAADIAALGLSVRTTETLRRVGINQVRTLLDASDERLLNVDNFGPRALAEIDRVLERHGLARRG